jgi:hypothetical protein
MCWAEVLTEEQLLQPRDIVVPVQDWPEGFSAGGKIAQRDAG